jgi:hypothetical protein
MYLEFDEGICEELLLGFLVGLGRHGKGLMNVNVELIVFWSQIDF